MHNTNNLFLRKATTSLEEESYISKKNINKLYTEKEQIIKKERIEKRGDSGANSSS